MAEILAALVLLMDRYPPAWVLAIVVAGVLCYRLPDILAVMFGGRRKRR